MAKKASRKEWERLIFKAVRDGKFRAAFVKAPEEAAAKLHIKSLGADARRLKRLKAAIKSVSPNKGLKPSDVKIWTIGVMQHTQLPNHPRKPRGGG